MCRNLIKRYEKWGESGKNVSNQRKNYGKLVKYLIKLEEKCHKNYEKWMNINSKY